MAANVPNPQIYLNSIANIYTQIRDFFQDCQDQSGYIASMGGVAFLTTAVPNGLGMSPPDANALIASLGNMSTLAVQYQGGAQAPALNYKANTEPFWGGL
jgi:hypothetical protein